MADRDNELVTFVVDGKYFKIRRRLKEVLEGKGELDDEFRATFTEEEKEVILLCLFVH